MAFYDFDRIGITPGESTEVRLFPGGPVHVLAPAPVMLQLSAYAVLAKLADGTFTTEDAETLMDLLRVSLPSAVSSGELERITPGQMFTLVALVRDGTLPSDLDARTAEGNGSTAAGVSSSPSPATPARSAKTRKKSSVASKQAH